MNAATLHRRRYRGSDPRRQAVGWGVVLAVHAFIGWALVSGTARRGLELIKKPMEAAVIQEVIIPPPPPPPPPPKKIEPPKPEMPKVVAPPPPYVPPPEVAPPVSSSAVAVQSVPLPPPTPHVIAPPPPPARPAPPAPAPAAGPVKQEMSVACPTQIKPDMPRQALRERIEGVVLAQARIRDGKVVDVTILSGPRVFHSVVRNAMLQYQCVTSGGEVLATQEFAFRVE